MSEMMSVLEGTCWLCGSDVEIERIGGVAGWLYGRAPGATCPYDLGKAKSINVWGRGVSDPVGGVEFKCTGCGAKFYAEQYRDGDWAM